MTASRAPWLEVAPAPPWNSDIEIGALTLVSWILGACWTCSWIAYGCSISLLVGLRINVAKTAYLGGVVVLSLLSLSLNDGLSVVLCQSVA